MGRAKEAAERASRIKVVLVKHLPQNVQDSLAKYKQNGWSNKGRTEGTRVGKGWDNIDKDTRKSLLPTNTTYKEYDVNDKIVGKDRDMQRFLKGEDGSIYYTSNHYGDFDDGLPAFKKVE